MAFDENQFTTTFTTAVADSFNDTEENTLDVDVAVADSFNTDESTNDSYNADVDLTDSFHEDSYNTDIDIDDSGNTDSYNDTWSFTDSSTTDNSVNAGVRSYDTGIGSLSFTGAAGAAGAGDVLINNQNTIVDQSASNNIVAFGDVTQKYANESVVASGSDSAAAGDDLTVTTNIDQSTHIDAGGDVLIDSGKTVTETIDSYNTHNFSWTETDESIEVDIDDSWNSHTLEVGVDNSFNDDSTAFDYTDVDVDVDAIVGSQGAVIADDIDLGF
jgi:hypothetical protein